jgi:mannose-6-phosphate isomerase
VGAAGVPRVVVCIAGEGQIEHGGAAYAARAGEVLLLPAALGSCAFQPRGTVNVLEIEIPE